MYWKFSHYIILISFIYKLVLMMSQVHPEIPVYTPFMKIIDKNSGRDFLIFNRVNSRCKYHLGKKYSNIGKTPNYRGEGFNNSTIIIICRLDKHDLFWWNKMYFMLFLFWNLNSKLSNAMWWYFIQWCSLKYINALNRNSKQFIHWCIYDMYKCNTSYRFFL